MARYLLIDTCIWKQLISATEFKPDLKIIAQLIADEDFVLLVPDVLKDEWFQKDREAEINKINKAFAGHRTNEKLSRTYNMEEAVYNKQKPYAERLLYSQIDQIDELLNNGILLTASQKVSDILFRHQRAGTAPFHKKKDSFNDGVMIFSSMDYVDHLKGENRLYFISENHTDFGYPDGAQHILHPNITKEFPAVALSYFTTVSDFRKAVSPKDFSGEGRNAQLNDSIQIDRDQPLLDQLHEYLQKRFSELKFLPIDLFAYHYPFPVSSKKPIYERAFTITTDNKELFQLFKERIENPVPDQKWEWIIQTLYANNVRFFSDDREHRLDIQGSIVQSTPLRQAFESMSFKSFHKLIQDADTDGFEKAYYLYKIGLFQDAAFLTEKLLMRQRNQIRQCRLSAGTILKGWSDLLSIIRNRPPIRVYCSG